MLADVVVPRRSGYCRYDLSCRHIQQIVVSVAAAKAGLGLHESQPEDDFVARVRGMWPEKQITLAQSHPAAMRKQIANRHFMRNVRIVHDESRKSLVHMVVPRQLPLVDKCGQCRSCERHRI